ncbi:MAG TPA: FecR domain-containing protein, partial [Niabella sp.]|nr:FecR domain-containing protein [Niabella sp.]
LKGEALFDIVDDSSSPFYVYTGNAQLKLQHATFNVNAYLQKTVVTLVNGQLEIKSGSSMASLTEGKHAMAVANAQSIKQTIILTEADTASALSWKKATRLYKDIPMREFVSDIARWYNLEIVNITCIPAAVRISVAMCYNTPIDQLLNIFSDSKLKFYKVGNRITFCDPALRATPAQPVPFKY